MTQTIRLPRKLTIFEGPDGGGKTTAAKAFAEHTGALYHHCGVYPRVGKSLARVYVEAMLPALLGYQDVVLDRCWTSESIYGEAMRGGDDRLGVGRRRMLERLAMRCAASMVLCLPQDPEVCLETYRLRKADEYLKKEKQLQEVYFLYSVRHKLMSLTHLPVTQLARDLVTVPADAMTLISAAARTEAHDLDLGTAGNIDATVLLVGESLAEQKDCDPSFRGPFVSFDGGGCSLWLTEQLNKAGIGEHHLMWANADDPQLADILQLASFKLVIALGEAAAAKLVRGHPRWPVKVVPHPQHAKRFHHKKKYELTKLINKELST